MAACSIGHKPCLLYVSGWDMDQTKKSKCMLNTLHSKVVSVILHYSYHTDVHQGVIFSTKFSLLFHLFDAKKKRVNIFDWLVIDWANLSHNHYNFTNLQINSVNVPTFPDRRWWRPQHFEPTPSPVTQHWTSVRSLHFQYPLQGGNMREMLTLLNSTVFMKAFYCQMRNNLP